MVFLTFLSWKNNHNQKEMKRREKPRTTFFHAASQGPSSEVESGKVMRGKKRTRKQNKRKEQKKKKKGGFVGAHFFFFLDYFFSPLQYKCLTLFPLALTSNTTQTTDRSIPLFFSLADTLLSFSRIQLVVLAQDESLSTQLVLRLLEPCPSMHSLWSKGHPAQGGSERY